jgi:hypothetical protein
MFGVLCDRVGADSLTEDLSGASYQAVCHYSDRGEYADNVDISVLPAVSGDKAERTRALGVAKIEAMARRRSELIRAFNAAFPDMDIDDATTEAAGDKVRLHDALMRFSQNLAPLYELNPYEPGGEAILPSQTRALGRLFTAFVTSLADVDNEENKAVREAMVRLAGRKGYRPSHVGLGGIRTALAYPDLRKLLGATLDVIGPGGAAAPALQTLLKAVSAEMKTAEVTVSKLPPYAVDPATVQPNRPRSTIEFAAALMLSQDEGFADAGEPPRYIALRDRRGFVTPVTSGGALPAPLVDLDGDGLADVDAFGRFVDAKGLPAAIDAPFAIPGVMGGPTDAFGRPASMPYQYIDTSRTMLGAVARSLVPLVDATQYAPAGDPEAWKSEHESLMYALAGAHVLFGPRVDAQYDFKSSKIVAKDEPCDGCLPYKRFRGEDSPLPDLIHATGQLLAAKDSDGVLAGLIDLVENHEDAVARLLGAALKIREIALEHDALARQGKEPFAVMPYETPIWDEMAVILGRIAARPGLTRKLVEAFGEDALVTPTADGSQHVGDTLSKFAMFRDDLTYDVNNINGPAVNLTVGAPDTSSPKTPVDHNAPKVGKNRSCLERSLMTIHDANGAKACNKQGAKVHASYGGFKISYPFFDSFDECELFTFENLAVTYLGSILPEDHPKRTELKLKSDFLSGLMAALGAFGGNPDDVFQESSGIDGLTLHPSPPALNRLVFFGADSDLYPNMPDHDFVNEDSQTNKFISGLIEPVSPSVCPQKPNGVRQCEDKKDVLRIRDANTIFLWERYGFYDYLRPLVTAFANESCEEDLSSCDLEDSTGEQIFIDIVEVLNRHWPGKEHGPECDKSGDAASNPRYCSEAGVNTYEPILAEAFAGDIVPALVEFSKIAREISVITVKRGEEAGDVWTGAEVLERTLKVLFSTGYATSVGMVDRKGSASTTWVDGTPQAQLTGFSLFADALHGLDARFDAACSCTGLSGQELIDCDANYGACRVDAEERKGQWKRARSQLVDQFLAVEGTGPEARFKNAATPKMLLATLKLTREQLNANCPNREAPMNEPCTWASRDLGKKLEETLSGPLFAALMDLQEALRANEPARRELERFLAYALSKESDNDAFQGMLASAADMLQVFADDADLAPIIRTIAGAADPSDAPEGPGAADAGVKVLKAMTSDDYDTYHVLDYVLPALVTPMDEGAGLSPIEVIMDVITDVNRIDAASQEPLVAEDYEAVMDSVRDFMSSETRGLEQIYAIVQGRPRE